MNTLIRSQHHRPRINNDVIGLDGYANTDSVVCLIANEDNNFLNEGIVENSILFVDTAKEYREGSLSIYQLTNADTPFMLSRTPVGGAEYFGRIILTINPYRE